MRLLAITLLCSLAAFGGILPEGMGKWKKEAAVPAVAPEAQTGHEAGRAKVWQEYGFQDGETTTFLDADRKMSISAWRFNDATGAMAAYDSLLAPDFAPTALSKRSAEDPRGALVAVGNYLFRFNDLKPNAAELNYLVGFVPRYAASPLPSLPGFLPRDGRVKGSERYILGPESLTRYAADVPLTTAAFHFGAEGESVRYGKPGKESTLLVFTYPTMDIARDRLPHFQAIPNSLVKRSGPMVATVLHSASPEDAERLLSQVKYQAEITVTERVPNLKDNPGNLFVNIAILVAVLAGFCLLSGLAVGGLKYLFRRGGSDGEGEPMISLHLTGRQ